MGFQFQCPKGHMLEADPSSIGQASACPFCGTQFLIPAPVAPTPTLPQGASGPQPGPGYPPQPAFGSPPASAFLNRPSPQQAFPPQPDSPPNPAQPPSAGMAGPAINVGPAGSPTKKEETLLHIPCPNGHELEVPSEMLEQEALCPTCQVQFRLRAKDSVEHKRRQQEAYERRQHKLGQAWLNWSVGIAVVVVLGLLALIVVKMSR